MSKQKEVERQIGSIEGMIRALEKATDPALRTKAKELVQALMALHGVSLERMLEIVGQAGASGKLIMDSFATDELVRSLLLLYGLHPVDLETRVLQALEKTRPYLRSHGGNVNLVGINDAGVVTLRLTGNCEGCPSSAATLKLAVEEAIYEAAPDITGILVPGAVPREVPPAAFVPLASLQENSLSRNQDTDEVEWEEVFGLEGLPSGVLRTEEVAGQAILFCRLEETFYAYNNSCPGCGQRLGASRLEGTVLACSICNLQYDVIHAGRGVNLTSLHLEPVPLLTQNGRAKIALESSRIQRSAK